MVARTGLFTKPLPGSPAQGTSPTDGRLVLGSLFGAGGGCIGGGVFTASGTAMQITLASSVWRIPDPTNSAAVFLSPADPNVFTFSAGPASGSRKDVLWVKQNNYENGDADSRLTYGIQVGVAASPGTEPAITTAGAMKIGVITVPAGVTNAAACTFVPAYPATAATPAIASTAKALLDTVPGTYLGQRGFAGGIDYRWNGTAWKAWDSDWVTYFPSFSGISIGTGGSATTYFAWRYAAGEIEVKWNLVLGTTGGFVNGDISFALPVSTGQAHYYDALGTVRFIKSGNAPLTGSVGVNVTVAFVRTQTGTNAAEGVASATSPFTWASGDACVGRMRYTPA